MKYGRFVLAPAVYCLSTAAVFAQVDSASVASKEEGIRAERLTEAVGAPYVTPLDTQRLNYGNATLVEGQSPAVGYLANMGSPAQTRIMWERKEARDFTYADAFDYYITTPTNACFYDTKTPYSQIIYTQMGASDGREDRLKGVLTSNFGKRVNVGAEGDYIYSRGQYASSGNKLMSYRLFGSYRVDRYELFAYLSNYNFVTYENGGLANDRYLTHADEFTVGRQPPSRKDYPTRLTDTWNRVRGTQYFLSHRYNLGFVEERNDSVRAFVPVASLSHTFAYESNRRRFISAMDTDDLDSLYLAPTNANGPESAYSSGATLNDSASARQVKNTLALSLREGFHRWAKFGLTAFATLEQRQFRLPANDSLSETHDELSLYVGAELSKRQGALLTYNARGEICMVGDDLGEFRLSGALHTAFPLFGKEAAVGAYGYLRNVTPAFFQRYHHSRYYWWDPQTQRLSNEQRAGVGGELRLDASHTVLSAGVESLWNYVYYNLQGVPGQYDGNLRVPFVRLKQDFYYRALGWENEAVYQVSSNPNVLPLPQFCAYTNLFIHFKAAKVLTVQAGADMHYHTAYYAPYYEPATQQFQLQNEKKVGNFPLINAYVNFHLKQARFFAMMYNVGSALFATDYFSLLHYPLNPMLLKVGVAVNFNN